MTKFVFVGLDSRGELQRFDLNAGTRKDAEQEAAQYARRTGFRLIEIHGTPSGRTGWSRHRRFSGRLRQSRFNVSLFVYELLALLRAGLALSEALETLSERWSKNRASARLAETSHYVPAELIRQMQQGKSFSSALSAHPECFPALFVAMISASEQTGEVVQTLERFLQYHNQVNVVRQKLIAASLYPALLLLTGIVVGFFLVWFLAPRFAHVYEGMTHAELPLLSQWLLDFGLFLSDHTVASLGCLSTAIVMLIALANRPSVQRRCLAALGRVRWISDMLKLMHLARFYRSVGMLLQGGVSLLPSLKMAQDLLPFELQGGLARSMSNIAQGKSMSECLQKEGLTTSVALRLLRAGERNGQIATMLEQSALFHEREISQWVERSAHLIEPLLMLIMGAGIGLIVVLLYLPIFDLAGSLQ